MTKYCLFCQGPVNPHDLGVWKQVVCWMLDGQMLTASMMQNTGVYAHSHCVTKAVDMVHERLGEGNTKGANEILEQFEERIDKAVEDAFEVLDEYHARVCIGQNDGRCKCP